MLETQKQEQDEIEYNNPRNEMDNMDNEVNTNFKSFQSLRKPKLKFSWLWLLFCVHIYGKR